MKCAFRRHLPALALNVAFCWLAFLLLLTSGCGSDEKPSPPLAPIPKSRVTIEGIGIRYIDAGKGRPLVLIHGIPTSSFLWRDMIPELSKQGRVIALDLPGFGFSDPPSDGDYTISNYARILGSFLDALAIKRATLVCHDLGGPIALTYAIRHPRNCQRLVIFDTFLHTDLPPWPLAMRIARIRPLGEIFMNLGGESIARSGLEDGVVVKSRMTDAVVRRYYMPDGKPDKLNNTILATLRVDHMRDLRFIETNLKTIDMPTLVVWGEKDVYLPLSLGNRIQEDITGSEWRVMPNCGHFVPEDYPERATRLIVEFLKH
jgi:pimeloyl-ACP methyl ester carboxylesterase